MIRMILAGAAALALAATATAAPKAAAKPAAKPATTKPAQCREKGKFVKCPAATASATTGSVTKDKNGRCHVANGPKKGQFTKCP